MTRNIEPGRQALADLKLLLDSFPEPRRKLVIAALRSVVADLSDTCELAGSACTMGTQFATGTRD